MSTFVETIQINAKPDTVWAVLADVGNIADWSPGLVGSSATNAKLGKGATRHCVISETQSLDEEVVRYDPPRAITFRITQSTMPFESADIRFTLDADGDATIVKVSPLYALKFGVFGRILDRLMVKRVYSKGMKGLLSGLKDHSEAKAGKVV